MTEDAAPVPGIRIGQVFNRSVALLLSDLPRFLLLSAIAWSPYLLLALIDAGQTEETDGLILRGIVALLWPFLGALGNAALLYGAVQRMRNADFSVGTSLRLGLARFLPILGLTLLSSLCIGIATLLLIVPGMILAMTWYVALPACVIERLRPYESMKRSAYLTEGNRWQIFAIAVALWFGDAVVSVVLSGALAETGGTALAATGVFVWTFLFGAFNAIVVAVLYHDLRVAREGVALERIAASFHGNLGSNRHL